MTCNCPPPDRSGLWSPIPDYRQPSDILPGENIDCYARRAGTMGKNDIAEKIPDRIDNTSLVTDLSLKVDDQFRLTPSSTRTAQTWVVTVGGVAITSVLPELQLDSVTGKISGTVTAAHAGTTYKVLVSARDGAGEIDSREFNFFPKKSAPDTTVRFVFPLPGGRITCAFGPRRPPAAGASSMHNGIDCAMPDRSRGDIVAAADGTVVKAGPASGFGNWIVIEHRDSVNQLVATTVYGHMNTGDIYVRVGDRVAAGQKIAREGNAGIGTAAHLHFELHKGSWRNPTDPVPYLNGNFQLAQNNLPGQPGIADPASYSSVTNANRGLTTREVSDPAAGCPDATPAPPPTSSEPATSAPVPSNYNNRAANRSACAPDGTVPVDSVMADINRALSEDPGLSAEDKKIIVQVAKIESNLDPFAKNPSSTATGLYQMLDKIAVRYYGIIGIPPTCTNRCNAYYATRAMIEFYKKEFVPYYQGWLASGKTTIANKPIKPTAFSATYASLSQGEFMYGLLHHDGVGNAVAGRDLGGVDYWRKKIRSA